MQLRASEPVARGIITQIVLLSMLLIIQMWILVVVTEIAFLLPLYLVQYIPV